MNIPSIMNSTNIEAENIPENDSSRESSNIRTGEFPHKSESAGNVLKPRFRESSAKLSSAPPRKLRNLDRRSREFLTSDEVGQLMDAAGKVGRHGHRDATMILVAYRHGLRVSELVALRWDHADLKQGLLHVRRRKNGSPSTHPLSGVELRALRRLQRDYDGSPFMFVSERLGPLTESNVRKMVARAGIEAGLPFPAHPHMLRHAAGYKLANDGQDTRAIQHYLGHKNITHTCRYTELSPERFKGFWQD
jgi:type 1 fimbriae regulatory protein FimB/type 1 fimbriae regulatory protein FimE